MNRSFGLRLNRRLSLLWITILLCSQWSSCEQGKGERERERKSSFLNKILAAYPVIPGTNGKGIDGDREKRAQGQFCKGEREKGLHFYYIFFLSNFFFYLLPPPPYERLFTISDSAAAFFQRKNKIGRKQEWLALLERRVILFPSCYRHQRSEPTRRSSGGGGRRRRSRCFLKVSKEVPVTYERGTVIISLGLMVVVH